MKTIRGSNIKDWSAYIFTVMTNIDETDPKFFLVNDFKGCKDESIVFNMAYCEENNIPHIVFNNIECIFRESGVLSYLIFCESDKNKNMLNRYVKVIDQLKEEILSFIGEYEDDLFIMGNKDSNLKLEINCLIIKKNNIPVCVIPVSSVVKKGDWYYPQIKLQECFYENDYLDEI